MGCAHKENQVGFTLVEISIVMIIIGLLIGGTFGGMKLIENMQVNKTVQDLKAIESAALTFKDTYGRLPGDIVNPAARLPNCTVAPCSTGGNGNRTLSTNASFAGTQTATDESFTFWHHLQAADLLNLDTQNNTNLEFGEGQPEASLGGYRVSSMNGPYIAGTTYPFRGGMITISTTHHTAPLSSLGWDTPCGPLQSVDTKIDDGLVYNGAAQGWACLAGPFSMTERYTVTNQGHFLYDLKGF